MVVIASMIADGPDFLQQELPAPNKTSRDTELPQPAAKRRRLLEPKSGQGTRQSPITLSESDSEEHSVSSIRDDQSSDEDADQSDRPKSFPVKIGSEEEDILQSDEDSESGEENRVYDLDAEDSDSGSHLDDLEDEDDDGDESYAPEQDEVDEAVAAIEDVAAEIELKKRFMKREARGQPIDKELEFSGVPFGDKYYKH